MTIPKKSLPRRLFETVQIGRYQLSNRIVMAPMTRNRTVEGGNVLTDLAPTYYGQRASAGLIITEATQTSEAAQGYWMTPGIHNEKQHAVWRRVAETVHGAGGRIFVQLWHTGRVFHPDNVSPHITSESPYARAPSTIAPKLEIVTPKGLQAVPVPKALTEREISTIVAEFAQASRWAIECGLDGVEIHGANGYLFDQFLNRSSNQRTDGYGGTVENRSRLLFEAVEAASKAIGADRVAVRISPFGTFNDVHDPEPEQIYRHVSKGLSQYDLAYLHVIRPVVSGNEDSEVQVADPLPEIRELYRGPLIVAGNLDVESADGLIDAGLADAVGFGRWFISNPDLPERLRNGTPLAEADRNTFYSGDAEGYADYPSYQESELAETT